MMSGLDLAWIDLRAINYIGSEYVQIHATLRPIDSLAPMNANNLFDWLCRIFCSWTVHHWLDTRAIRDL